MKPAGQAAVARGAAREAAVLRFWRTVELFSPQTVPAVQPSDDTRPVMRLMLDGQPPWQSQHRRRPARVGWTWRHTVYLGVYAIERVYDVLRTVFEPDEDSYDARPDGMSALAAIQVSDDGQFLWGSELLSSCAWATGRALYPGPSAAGWLEGFGAAQHEFTALVHEVTGASGDHTSADRVPDSADRVQASGEPAGRPMTAAALAKLRDEVAAMLGVAVALPCADIRVETRLVKVVDAETLDNDFLNSFIADDLDHVATQAACGNVGAALHAYLRESARMAQSARVDVHDPANLAIVHDAVTPLRAPLGRWPADVNHPLALGQQLAVNKIMNGLSGSSGIFAVNGPPGTGKTTMLRDLIAAVVVERACRLAELPRASDAFTGEYTWKTGQYTRHVQRWAPQLTGFEIVIASSNNGAVQNVTDEIPAQSAIADTWRGKIDHFTDIATALLAVDADTRGSVPEVVQGWGLIAGRLGNKRNRSRFANTLWYDENHRDDVGDGDGRLRRVGIKTILQQLERTPAVPWNVAIADFSAARHRVEAAARDRARVAAAVADLPVAVSDEQRHQAAAAVAEKAARQHAARANQLSANLATATASRENVLQRRRTHHQFKPGLLYVLFTMAGRRAHRDWASLDAHLQAVLTRIEQTVGALEVQHADAVAAAADARRAADAGQAAARDAARRVEALTAQIDAARERWNGTVPNADWWNPDNVAQRELAAPWLDGEFNRARSGLFLAALCLHRAFLAQVPKQMRQSLHGAIDILTGEAPADLPPEKALAAWQALFFLVPIVSTTFASFDRIFGHLGREVLGWLFIDEAGQATPQSAVGAIWRSCRVVVVGDPLQLEPVLTIPFRAQQAIRNDHGVAEEWVPGATSVQRLADRLTPIGTTVCTSESPIWVGCPLRVHRRCDEPMFTIVNQVAYQSRMIAAPKQRPPVGLRPSAWIDVTGHTAQGHWIREEHDVLLSMLNCLAGCEQDMAQVFVITPFRDVARRLLRLPDRYGERLRTGTIHTAQGKEADIVFFVLGGDPVKPGAKRWAANPNLINVAVSRARRRLYVIGDHSAWTKHPNLALVAQPPLQRITPEEASRMP